MNIMTRLLGIQSSSSGADSEHEIIVSFSWSGINDMQPLRELEEGLAAAVAAAQVGEYDGHELAVDGGSGVLFMYGPDADRLFTAIRPVLERCDFMRGARVSLHYGPAGAGGRVRVVVLRCT